eukprot:symbB.v1.2.028979.t1/scaffold2981.1/size65978/4
MAFAAALCLALSCASFGIGVRFLESEGSQDAWPHSMALFEDDLNVENKDGDAWWWWRDGDPLILAAKNGDKWTVGELIDAKADVNVQDENGYTALMWAIINFNADLHLKGRSFDRLSLNWGVKTTDLYRTEIVKELINAKADLNLKDKNGDTALMWAAKKGHREIVKELISAKADLNLKDKDGNTALILAAKKGHTGIVRELLPHETWWSVFLPQQ